MAWRIIEVPDSEAKESDLDNTELIGVSILLREYSGEPRDPQVNIYWRAYQKIQPQVEAALKRKKAGR